MLNHRLANEVPFGSAGHLSERICSVYSSLLEFIADHSAGATELLSAIRSIEDSQRSLVLRDSLTRRTIEDGVCRYGQGLDTIDPELLDQLLSGAARAALTPRPSYLDASGCCLSLGPLDRSSFVWMNARDDSPPGRRFTDELLKRLPGLIVEKPTTDQIDLLTSGVELALSIAPELATSALDHAFLFVIGSSEQETNQFVSMTVPGLPGVALVSPSVFGDPYRVAYTLLHEAMHLKFLDTDYVLPLFADGFRAVSSPRVTPIWHAGKEGYGQWPIDRVLTSMHVYNSLAEFFDLATSAGAAGTYGPKLPSEDPDLCRERARWLHARAEEHLDWLSVSGREFVNFNGSILEQSESAFQS